MPGSPAAGFLSPPFTIQATPSGSSGGLLLGPTISTPQGVCIAFSSSTLSTTPQWQRLDDPNGPFTVTGWEISRGRSFELDRTQAGTAVVRMIDTTGDFDPTNVSGAFYANLNPLKQAAIALQNPVSGTWFTLFRGFVDDLVVDVDVTGNYATVEFQLVDGFDLLSAAELYPGVAGHSSASVVGDVWFNTQTVEQRMHKVLDDAGWPNAWRDVFSGNVNVQQVVYPPRTDALTVLQDTADSEFPGVANCYMARDTGAFTFHGRYARFRPAVVQYGIDTWAVGDHAAVQSAPTTTALVAGVSFHRGKRNLINAALVTPQNIDGANIAGQLARDTSSIGTYGTRSESFENLLTYTSLEDGSTALQETKKFANYYKNNFATPRNRISTLRFRSIPPSATGGSAMWRFLCNVEISDKVSVTTSHPGSGGFNADEFYVEGIRYSARPWKDSYPLVDMELDVSPVGYYGTEPA